MPRTPIQKFVPGRRCQTFDGICEYLSISHRTYQSWRSRGIVPGPIAGTDRYDVRQHDLLLDVRAGIAAHNAQRPPSPLEAFEASFAD